MTRPHRRRGSVSFCTVAAMGRKLRYEISLERPLAVETPDDVRIRPIVEADLNSLAALMLDSYIGTIDYTGETLDDAIEEVRRFFERGNPLLNQSLVVEEGDELVSAVLISIEEDAPFIAYVMTNASRKKEGLAKLVTKTSLKRLKDAGHGNVVFYITEGNAPSEGLFASLGARRIPGGRA